MTTSQAPLSLRHRLDQYEKLMRLDKPHHGIYSCGHQVA
jgi:hypothetical protein